MTKPAEEQKALVSRMAEEVERFGRDLIGLNIPKEPTIPPPDRCRFRLDHLKEELQEAEKAVKERDIDELADGLIDLIYVALGFLLEAGIPPGVVFDEVHAANMRKERGSIAKRPDGGGFDAVKPEGWSGPNIGGVLAMLSVHREDVLNAMDDRVHNRIGGLDISPVLVEVSRLRKEKGHDYNHGPVKLQDYFPFGMVSYSQMIYLKAKRLESLCHLVLSGGEPKFEGFRGSLVDIINYGTYAVEYIDFYKKKGAAV